MAISNIAPAVAQRQDSQVQESASTVTTFEKFPPEIAMDNVPEDSLGNATAIQGSNRKKRSLLGKVGSFMADLFFGGEYPDGYTSFVSYQLLT